MHLSTQQNNNTQYSVDSQRCGYQLHEKIRQAYKAFSLAGLAYLAFWYFGPDITGCL